MYEGYWLIFFYTELNYKGKVLMFFFQNSRVMCITDQRD